MTTHSPSTFSPNASRGPRNSNPPPLSPQLEQEISEDDLEFTTYGGDAPDHRERDNRRSTSTAQTRHSSTIVGSVDEDAANRVDWDCPLDPTNPQNFSYWKKMGITAIIILLTINVTFASSAPSTTIQAIATEFGTTMEVGILITSLFLVGYVFGPIFWSGLSETFGRRNVYLVTIAGYTLFTIGQALGKNIETVLITRFLAGFFGSSPLTNGGGVIADIWDAVGRGPAVSIFTASVFIGPIIGPIMGAFVVTDNSLGWRWVFWILVIISGLFWLITLFFLPETFAPVLLARKARRLRKENPEKNAALRSDLESQDWSLRGILDRTIFRPFIMLFKEPILMLITVYLSLIYGLIYALFQVFPIIFIEVHGIPMKLVGLTFIGVGIGTTIGALIFYLQSRSYPELAKKWRGHPPAEARLPAAMIGGPLLVISIFGLCWTGAYKSVPWYVPEIMAIPFGCAIATVFITFQSYLVDTYLMYSASALAATAMIRSAAGAAFPLFTDQMFHHLGVQWAGTLIGCIALLLAPSPFIFYRYGAWIRTKSTFAPCLDLKIKEEVEREEREKSGLAQVQVA